MVVPNDSYHRNSETGMLSSGVKTADAAIKATPGKVYWITIYAATTGVVQLNDSTADDGTDVWQATIGTAQASGFAHCIFDPPLEFATGIYLDVPTGTPDVIVGYI